MKRTLFFVLSLFIIGSCSDDNNDNRTPSATDNEIKLSAGIATRAAADQFPNASGGAAQVIIVAKKTSDTDWDTPYIDHKPANVGSGTGDNFTLSWPADGKQYWPVGGASLTFISYSPVSMKNDDSPMMLNIILDPEDNTLVPDIIVATKNSAGNPITASYNGTVQSPAEVNFQYEHILSQLQVELKGVNTNTGAKVTKVEIKVDDTGTERGYNIINKMWATMIGGDNPATYTFDNSGDGWELTGSAKTVNTRPLLLFGGTENLVSITLYVKSFEDETETELATIKVNQAKNGELPASLKAGHLTTVTINVNGVEITGMTAGVTGWVDMGKFTVNVE